VAPAGFRFVSGLLAKANVSACDGAAEITGIAVAIARAIAVNLLRGMNIYCSFVLVLK
jgi:hypothetical protein